MSNIESIETLANPSEYQINALSYLFKILFPDNLYFVKQLFTLDIYDNFSSEIEVVKYLKEYADIDEETAKKMYEDVYMDLKILKDFINIYLF